MKKAAWHRPAQEPQHVVQMLVHNVDLPWCTHSVHLSMPVYKYNVYINMPRARSDMLLNTRWGMGCT